MSGYKKPDYKRLRNDAGFTWWVSGSPRALMGRLVISMEEYNLNPDAFIEVYRKGRPLAREMFGGDVAIASPSTPEISYGHANTRGSRLLFPENSEVGFEPVYSTLEEAVKTLKKPIDFATSGMMPFYLDFHKKVQAAFPDEKVDFSFSGAGVITTAWELRGEDFFLDLYDNPELLCEFLTLVVDDMLAYRRFRDKLTGAPSEPATVTLSDDLSSMISPGMWDKFVLPFWDRYYRHRSAGPRHAHVENLRQGHLQYLEKAALSYWDPSISPELNPKLIAAKTRVPFCWRLGGFHYATMTCQDVEDWVFQACADGASNIFTVYEQIMCDDETIRKVNTFIAAAKEAKEVVDKGFGRQEIARRVSPRGKKRFWDHWPDK